MPVQWQNLPVSLDAGLNTKSDDFSNQPGEVISLVNGSYKRAGGVQKRRGFTAAVNGTLTTPRALFQLDGETLAVDDASLKGLRTATSDWATLGTCRSIPVQSGIIADSANPLVQADAATASGVTVHAWIDRTDNTLRCRVVVDATGSTLTSSANLSSAAPIALQCLAVGQYLFILYTQAGVNLKARRIDSLAPTVIGAEVNLATVNNGQFRACVNGSGFSVLVRNAATTCTVATFTNVPALSATSAAFGAAYAPTIFNAGCMYLGVHGSNLVALFEQTSGSIWAQSLVASSLALSGAAFLIEDLSTSFVIYHAAFGVCPTDSTQIAVVYDVYAAGGGGTTYNRRTRLAYVKPSGPTVNSTQDLFRSASLASDVFTQGGRLFAWLKYYSTATITASTLGGLATISANSAYWLVSIDDLAAGTTLAARALDRGRAGDCPTSSSPSYLPGMYQATANVWACDLASTAAAETSARAPSVTIPVVSKVVASFATERPRGLVMGKSLQVLGSSTSSYDFAAVVEAGFAHFPETPTAASLGALTAWAASTAYVVGTVRKPTVANGHTYVCVKAGTSGLVEPTWPLTARTRVSDGTAIWAEAGGDTGAVTAGTYTYQVHAEWVDSVGQLWRSPVSPAVSITLGGTGGVFLTLPTMRITKKQGARIIISRSSATTTTPLRVDYVLNDTTLDAVYFVDTYADTSLFSGSPLYTAGGALTDWAPPSCTLGCVRGQRMFLAGLEDPTRIAVSKLWTAGYGVSFNGALELSADASGGAVTALAAMDDNVVIFQAGRISVLGGDGPNDTLTSGGFVGPRPVSSSLGCSNPDSVVLGDAGLYFQASNGRGIWLLSRQMQLQYIGAQVEAFNGTTITAAANAPDRHEVRFLASSYSAGSTATLCYDTLLGKWAVWSTVAGVDAGSYGGRWAYLTSGGKLAEENAEGSTAFDIDGSVPSLSLTLGFYFFAGIAGFLRLRGFELLWSASEAHNIACTFTAGTDGTPIALSTAALSAGPPNARTFYWAAPIQKLDGFKLTLSDSGSGGSSVYDLDIKGLNFVVGLKPGVKRLPASRRGG